MSGPEEDIERSFDATPQKLQKAREKGETARSNDLLTAAAYLGFLAALLMSGGSGIQQIADGLTLLLDQAVPLASIVFSGASGPILGGLIWPILIGVLPLFLAPTITTLIAIFAQRAMVFAPSKLAPKISRISLISNFKNKFNRNSFFEFFKSFAKLLIYSVLLAIFINLRLKEMIATLQSEPALVVAILAKQCVAFVFIAVLISTVIGGVDAVWQHFEHLRKNKMSYQEITDETKANEGDPNLKQKRRQRAMTLSQNQMMNDVPAADVIIVNPTHYAIALKWSRKAGEAPVCVAKGIDEIALKIREIGKLHSVPIHNDPPSARLLCAATEIGQEFYHAVGAAIRFAEALKDNVKFRI